MTLPSYTFAGHRQVGQNNIGKGIPESHMKADYYTLDNAGTLAAVIDDPVALSPGLEKPANN